MSYSFLISTHNNLNYLKLCVDSIARHRAYWEVPIVILAERCIDGTNEWLVEAQRRYESLTFYIENSELGIGGGMNYVADKCTTPRMIFLHSDMVISTGFDATLNQLWHEKKGVVSAFRVEPDIFNKLPADVKVTATEPGLITAKRDAFGEYYHNFNVDKWYEWSAATIQQNKEAGGLRKALGAGGFIVSKADWDKVGGNDIRFNPACYDDIDLFIRMQMESIPFYMTPSAILYHFGARGSHFMVDDLSTKSIRQIEAERTGFHKWIDKWGEAPHYDSLGFITIPSTVKSNKCAIN